MAKDRPKPPPLDAGDTTLGDDELAAQGKTTLGELEAKLAEAGSSKSPTAPPSLETQSDGELAARAARAAAPPPQLPPPVAAPREAPRAVIKSSKSGYLARPDPAYPVGDDVPVVRFHWQGLVGGTRVDIGAGTPAECLPSELVDLILGTRHAIIAPRGPKPPPNPHAP
jgi:hypothetical protein